VVEVGSIQNAFLRIFSIIMVEFGLKLEDNKVSEWNEHYIDYDKLKAILKHAKTAQKKYNELATKRPDDATKIVEAYQKGDTKFVTLSPSPSKASLQQLLVDAEANSSKAAAADPAITTERTSLLARSIDSNMDWLNSSSNGVGAGTAGNYVTVGSQTFQSPNRKAEGGSALLTLEQQQQQQNELDDQQAGEQRSSYRSTFTGITEYFGSRYERSMREHLKKVDQNAQEFGLVLLEEVDKVSKFYYSKLEELETQLKVLIENVAESYNIHVVEEYDVDERNNNLYVAHGGGGNSAGAGADETFPTTTSTLHRRTSSANAANTRKNHPGRLSLTDQGQHLIHLVSAFTKKKKEQWEIENLKVTEEGASDEEEDQEDYDNPNKQPKSAMKKKNDAKREDSPPSPRKKKLGETDSIKRALIDQYRTAKLLHNFAIMNYTGFVKIVKKHDKTVPEAKGRYKQVMEPSNLFYEGQAVEELANRLEKFYAVWFCDGDIRAAHAQMLPKKGDGLEMDWTQLRYVECLCVFVLLSFKLLELQLRCLTHPRTNQLSSHIDSLGYRMGMCAVLGMWVCWDCIWGLVKDGKTTIGGRAAFPVFRACGGILALQWFWGCSVFIWTRYRVNYIYLFDFDPRIVATPLGIFQNAVDNTLVFMILTLLYYKVRQSTTKKSLSW
jgi:SPX domain